MIIVRARCPDCAAPLGLADGQRHVLCGYCDASLEVQRGGAGAGDEPTLTRQQVPAAEIDRVKQLVLDGKRAEAIAHYAQVAGLAAADAEGAVDQLMWPTIWGLIRQLPLNAGGVVAHVVVVLLLAGVAAFATGRALAGAGAYVALAVPAAVLAALVLRLFLPKVRSSWTNRFGSLGRARVLTRVVVRPRFVRGGSIVVVAFQVEPAGGGAPFVDEEVLLLRDGSVDKLAPGNIVAVRYDEPGRRRVFPISPIEVIGGA